MPGQDLDGIWVRIARDAGIQSADRFVDNITDKFPMLAGMPDAGTLREDLESDLRAFPVHAYLIYCRRAQHGGIVISRAIHGMRDQRKAWAGDDE